MKPIRRSQMLSDVFGMDGVIVLIVVVVLVFGGAAIPKLARNLGSAKNEFEKGLQESKGVAVDPAGHEPVAGASTAAPTQGAAETSTLDNPREILSPANGRSSHSVTVEQ
jgi:Sec-independent protein translocase protein TatA